MKIGDEIRDLRSAIRMTLLGISVILFIGGLILSFCGNSSGAAATYVAAVFCLIFVFLSQFKKFSGMGIQAEMWEQKMEEAEQIIDRLQALSTVIVEPVVIAMSRMGRWGGGVTRRERYEIASTIEGELRRIGVPQASIDKAMLDYHKYVLIDMSSPLRKHIRERVSMRRKEAAERALKAAHEQGDQAAIDKAKELQKSANSSDNKILDGIGDERFPYLYDKVIRYIDSEPCLSAEDKTEILEKNSELIKDLQMYASEKKFRRIEIWLSEEY